MGMNIWHAWALWWLSVSLSSFAPVKKPTAAILTFKRRD